MFTQLTAATYPEAFAAAEKGIVLCSKKLCPHCKNMEKVVEKFSVQRPGLVYFKIDSEEEPEAMKHLDSERVPTILILKGGKIAARKSGLMNPKELAAMYDAAK